MIDGVPSDNDRPHHPVEYVAAYLVCLVDHCDGVASQHTTRSMVHSVGKLCWQDQSAHQLDSRTEGVVGDARSPHPWLLHS